MNICDRKLKVRQPNTRRKELSVSLHMSQSFQSPRAAVKLVLWWKMLYMIENKRLTLFMASDHMWQKNSRLEELSKTHRNRSHLFWQRAFIIYQTTRLPGCVQPASVNVLQQRKVPHRDLNSVLILLIRLSLPAALLSCHFLFFFWTISLCESWLVTCVMTQGNP